MSAYAELAVTTNFSFLRGASHPQEYVAQAQALGHHAVGIADRNTLAGVVRAHVEAKKRGMRLLVGARLVTRDGFEAIAYPMDREAYGRLCRLLSAGNLRAKKGTCDIDFEEMLAARDGQILIAMPPPRLTPAFANRLAAVATSAPHSTYLAAAHRFDGRDRQRLGRLDELGTRTGAPIIAVTDALYHTPERRPLQDVLTCIREGCTVAEAGYSLEAHAERHLKPAAVMARLFAEYPEAVSRTVEVAEACSFSLDELKYNYPDEPVPPHKTPQQHLEDLTWAGARWRYPDGLEPKVEATLREELRLIAECGYAHYFLTVYDVVRFAETRGILCQGRGSAANSAVCYCLGITAIDPVKSNLLFARFISRVRDEPPDIDVDFEHERREEVIQYLYRRYGRDRAAICATVIHYRPRMAIREVGKALGLTPDITAALSDTVWGSWGNNLPEAQVRQAGLDPANPAIRQAVDLANELIGFPRHLSQHVGGFVLSQNRIDETVPIGPAAMEGRTFIEWDKDDIDAVHLLKVDVLALGMLSCLKRGLELLKLHYRKDYPTLADIPQEAPEVYEMLSRADSVGVFQVESRAQMSMLPRLRPQKFYDLVVEVAIVRPGPIQGNMVHPYLRRRENPDGVHYPGPHPSHGDPNELKDVLAKTFGVPLFQEQAMKIAMVAAKFTAEKADGLRRAMATFRHNGLIHLYREEFIDGMTARGYPHDFAERCFKQIEGFSTYGFPESHAASFALLVYASAWMKCFYPDVFCAAILNSQPMGFYRPAQLVRDAREHGVEVLHPDVNFSEWDCTLEHASAASPHRFAVRLGFRQIVGAKEDEMRRLVDARGNGFASVEQIGAVEGVQLATLETLADADTFRSMELDRRAALWAVRGLDGLGWRAGAAAEVPLLAPHLGDGLFQELPVALRPMSEGEQVAEDYLSLGLSLRAHPVSFLRGRLHRMGVGTNASHRRPGLAQNARIAVSGLVLTRQRPGTAKGVVFLTLEDETGIANVIVWPDRFEANRRTVMTARLLAVRGRLQRAGEVVHVLAEDVLDLSADLRRLRDDEPADRSDAPLTNEDTLRLKSRNFH
ncbi:MAG TPA: error-prone DNA polymerase [Microvirga sp.]|jgi:error-prone DNA polymerase|nr:error-prone DNA polymerase [Microvirga sp.]